METADIITLIGIIITAVLAGANLVTAFFNQRQSQGYNLRMADYERRYVQLTDNVSQYISMLDAHWLSFMALNEEEYEGKDAEIYERYHQIETAHYKIKLLLSNENQFFQEFCTILDDSLAVADKVRFSNSVAELCSNGLRNPDGFLDAYKKVLERKEDLTGVVPASDAIDAAKEYRDTHIRQFLLAAENLVSFRERLVSITQKYLECEKERVLEGQGK